MGPVKQHDQRGMFPLPWALEKEETEAGKRRESVTSQNDERRSGGAGPFPLGRSPRSPAPSTPSCMVEPDNCPEQSIKMNSASPRAVGSLLINNNCTASSAHRALCVCGSHQPNKPPPWWDTWQKTSLVETIKPEQLLPPSFPCKKQQLCKITHAGNKRILKILPSSQL